MTDIQSGPSEYKLGAPSTQSDIHFQANSDFSVAEVTNWTQNEIAILHFGALNDIYRLFRSLVSDPGNIGINYKKIGGPLQTKCRKEQQRALFHHQ